MRPAAGWLALAVFGTIGAGGQEAPIPPRPEALRFPPLAFAVPDAGRIRHQLPNGVPVYVVEDHALPLVEIDLALRVGGFLDPPGETGLASLTAAMLRRGGAGTRSADELDLAIDALGADLDSVGGGLRSGVSLECLSRVLPQALDLFFSVLREPRFEPARLAAAKANLTASLVRRNDDPGEELEREWGRLVFGPDAFSVRDLTPASLAAIDRGDLVAFHRRNFRPENMVLAVAGDVDTDTILRRLAEGFAGWNPPGAAPPWPPPATSFTPSPGVYLLDRDIPQAKVALGHRGPEIEAGDPSAAVLLLTDEILGGGGTVSRLRSRLRAEESLVYEAGSRIGFAGAGPADFRIFFATDNHNVAKAARLAVGEIERLRHEPVPAAELGFAKKGLVDAFPLLFDDARKIAGRFAEDELVGRPHAYWTDYRRRIEAVSAREIQDAARRDLHPDRLVILIIGRRGEILGSPAAAETLRDLGGGRLVELPRRDPVTLDPLPRSSAPAQRPGG